MAWVLSIGAASIDPDRGVIRAGNGSETVLRPQSADVLRVLAQSPGAVVSKRALMDAVWGDIAVTEDSLVQCIADIRRALGPDARDELRTVPRRGYVLDLGAAPTPRRRAVRIGGAVAAMLVLTAALVWTAAPWRTGVPEDAQELAHSRAPHASILVLPFADLSPDGEMGHFADGMTEDIIVALSLWGEIRVASRSTANSFRGKSIDARDAARSVDVRYVLEGAVRREGDMLRITAQLIDGRSGHGIWASRFDETGADLLAMQDAITDRIAIALTGANGAITRDERGKAWAMASVDLDEYDYYLRGHEVFYHYTPEGIREAREIWQGGLRRYPGSGLLKIKLGWAEHFIATYFATSEAEAVAAQAAAKALVLDGLADPQLPPAGTRFGLWLLADNLVRFDRDCAAGLSVAREIVETYPHDSESVLWSADNAAFCGAGTLADTWLEAALAGDAGFTNAHRGSAARVHYWRGRYDDALAGFVGGAVGSFTTPEHIATLVALGDLDGARKLAARLAVAEPQFSPFLLAVSRPLADRALFDQMVARLAEAGWPPVVALQATGADAPISDRAE